MNLLKIGNFSIGKGQPLTLISGPCVIESETLCLNVAEQLKALCQKKGVNLIFKSSYDKANRSSGRSYRGPGLDEGLRILSKIQRELGIPVVTDVHTSEEATATGQVCDMIQIPAFLCRQTDLILAASRTGKAISVKKGQFMAPWDMKNIIEKINSENNKNILLIDRGVSFGYNNLVSDMRAIPIMQSLGYPVCFDATHSVQLPGKLGESSGGERQYVKTLARAALAAGADCLFVETHPNPSEAKSDATTQLQLEELFNEVDIWIQLHQLIQESA